MNRLANMKRIVLSVLFCIAIFGIHSCSSSKHTKRRPPKESSKPTVSDANQEEMTARAAKEEEYKTKKEHQLEIQDKATRKRMKKTYKKAEKQSWGMDTPWYKRIFQRKKF